MGTTIDGKTLRSPAGSDEFPLYPDGKATVSGLLASANGTTAAATDSSVKLATTAFVKAALNGFFSVLADGADPTGATDSTAAINTTLARGGVTFFPAGLYTHTTIHPPAGAYLLGCSAAAIDVPYQAGQSTLQLQAGTNTHQFVIDNAKNNVTFENLWIDGNKINQTGTSSCIHISDAGSYSNTFCRILKCAVWHGLSHCVYIGTHRGANLISQSFLWWSLQECVYITSTDNMIKDSFIGLAGNSSVPDGPDASAALIANDGGADGIVIAPGAGVCEVSGGGVFRNRIGINVSEDLCTIVGVGIDSNWWYGIDVAVAAKRCTIQGNLLHGNGRGANNTYAHIIVVSGAFASIVGNIFHDDGQPNKTSYAAQSLGTANVTYLANLYAAGTSASGETSGIFAVSAPTVTSGVAFTPSASTDAMCYLTYATAGSITSVTMGPSTGTENTIFGAEVVATGGYSQSLRVPAGWKVVVTTVTSTITAAVVTC